MGCLNSTAASGKPFPHWFGNIHLSGPCNRSCYFCIGQHMLALDAFDTLRTWPLPGFDTFVAECRARTVSAVYVTGTNTDPLLYLPTAALTRALRAALPGCPVGIRTNGVACSGTALAAWACYDRASLTICALDPGINTRMMGGPPPDLGSWLSLPGPADVKVNVVLGPENLAHIPALLDGLALHGPRRVNLREPYGQPRVGDPLASRLFAAFHDKGMPHYVWGPLDVCYWDVHVVEVESVNLYASGRVSLDYPITRGHDDTGIVQPQSAFLGGRVRAQWLGSAARAIRSEGERGRG